MKRISIESGEGKPTWANTDVHFCKGLLPPIVDTRIPVSFLKIGKKSTGGFFPVTMKVWVAEEKIHPEMLKIGKLSIFTKTIIIKSFFRNLLNRIKGIK